MLLRLRPDEWIPVPGTPIELHADCDTMIRRNDHNGVWDIGLVPGVLLARLILPGGRRSWPWPITPLPHRIRTTPTKPPRHQPTTAAPMSVAAVASRPPARQRLAAALGWQQPRHFSDEDRRRLDAEFEAAQTQARRYYGLDTDRKGEHERR